MCPAQVKATTDEIVSAARDIIAQSGSAGLSLSAVAEAVGVRAPSLYKRFASRAALMSAVREVALHELASRLRVAQQKKRGRAAVRAMADAYRAWAKREPHLYQLVHEHAAAGPTAAASAATAPVLEELAALAGPDNALHAARLFTSFLHGFVSMENNGSFKMGGSVDAAFAFGLDAMIRGVDRGSR
jgi:AcrR family transcriptional regulator